MLTVARWQRHLVAALHLEPLLKWDHMEGGARNEGSMNTHPAMHRSKGYDIDDSQRLAALLRRLGMSVDIVDTSIRRNDETIARAAALISEWMTYLPENCVKAMVSDGWQWSV